MPKANDKVTDVMVVMSGPPAKAEAVAAAAEKAVQGILEKHTKAEAIAKLNYLVAVFKSADQKIREMIIPEIKDCAGADAYDHWTISAGKMKAKYQFPDDDMHLQSLRKLLNAAKEDLEQYEEQLIRNGKAVDLNRDKLTVTLRERKEKP